MSEVSDEPIKKLSEAITENNEIIAEINNLIKDMKGVKDVNDATIDKYKKESNELIEDIDDIIDVMETCQQADDPTLKSFDSKKKTAKSNSEKAKRQLLETLSKMEKTLEKSKETELKKKKGILKNGSKKEDEEEKNKKSEKDKKKDTDTLSVKSGAGSSAVENIDEVEEDLASDVEDENQDKVKESNKEKGKHGKDANKNVKSSKEKKKEKDQPIDAEKEEHKKKKGKKDDESKSKNKEITNDNPKDESIVVDYDEIKKPQKASRSKGLKSNKEDNIKPNDDKKEKTKKGKSKKSNDSDGVSVTNEDSFVEDIDEDMEKKSKKNDGKTLDDVESTGDKADKDKKHKGNKKNKNEAESVEDKTKDSSNESKHKKQKTKIVEDNQSLDDTNVESLEHDSKKKDKKTKDKKHDDTQSVTDTKENVSEHDTKKKDKKAKDKKHDDIQSVSDSKENVSDTKKKDKKSEKHDKKNDTSNIKEKELKKPLERSEMKDLESDKEIGTPSLRTQESIKSESDFYEDFESDEEDNNKEIVVMKKSAPTESKAPDSHSKPTSSLTRQKVINSDEEDDTNTARTEGELAASTTFEKIDGFYVVIKSFKAESEDDLKASVGEQLTILDVGDDGWWLARNSNGDEGFVPISCLKPLKDSRDTLVPVKTQDIPEQTIVQKEMKTESKEIQDHESNQLWDQIQQTMKEKGLNDTLKAFGSLPAGFRFSTLATWASKDSVECSMKAHLCPKLSDSDLSFKDLQYDTVENKIRPRPVRIQRIVQIVKSFQMPSTSDKFVVKSRHVRMCLFNGEKAISNIHTMRGVVTDKDLKTWNFNSKIADSTNSLDFFEIFIRTNHSSTEISLLLEFCMLGFKSKQAVATNTETESVPRKSIGVKINEEFTDDELIEFSTGWTKIALYDENGQLITNRNADYELFGGTPYEEGLEVDPNISRNAATGVKFKTLLNQSKQPQVSVRISLPSKDNKDLMETLPDALIGSTLHLTNLSYYRRILCEELMDRRQNLTSAEPIYSPFLVSFLQTADYPDILDMMRTIWNEKTKSLKNLDKKDYGKMNKVFQEAYMEYIYPLSKITSLRPPSLAHQDTEQIRSVKIKEFVQRVKLDKLSVLLSGDYSYAPLSFEEFSYKVVSKYSKTLKI